jgi:flagellar assembly protein FliH
LSEKIDTIATRRGFAGKVVLLAETSVAPGDCRIEWADGGVERDSARLWRDIDLAVARLLGDGEDHEHGQRHGASS